MIVGEVTVLADKVLRTPVPDPQPLPPDHPKSQESVGTRLSAEFIYSVKVTHVITSPESLLNNEIAIIQDGLAERVQYGADGEEFLTLELTDLPPLEVGKSYLLFLGTGTGDTTELARVRPLGRFLVNLEQRLEAVDPNALQVPALASLNGLTLPEATARIQQAVSESQLPLAPRQ